MAPSLQQSLCTGHSSSRSLPQSSCRCLSSSKVSCRPVQRSQQLQNLTLLIVNLVASWMHHHPYRCFQEHLIMLLQCLRALCNAPGRAGWIWKYSEVVVRATGVPGRFVYAFRTELHFADGAPALLPGGAGGVPGRDGVPTRGGLLGWGEVSTGASRLLRSPWRCTCAFASPACFQIPWGAILAWKAFVQVALMKHRLDSFSCPQLYYHCRTQS